MLIKTNICQILVEVYQIFNQSKQRCPYSDPIGPTSQMKTRSLMEIFLFIILEKVINYRL